MSFLSEVLTSAEVAASTHNTEVKKRLKEEISNIEVEVKKYMQDKYLQKASNKLNYNIYLNKINACEIDITSLIDNSAPDTKYKIGECTSQLKTYQNELKEALITLQTVSALITIDKSFKDIRLYMKKKQYAEASSALIQIDELMSREDLHLHNLDLFTDMNSAYRNKYLCFIEEIGNVWCENLQCSEQKALNLQIVELAIKKNSASCEMIHELLKIFVKHNYKNLISDLSKFFMKNILSPIIRYNVTITLKEEDDEKKHVLHLEFDSSSTSTPTYSEVFSKVQIAFSFIECYNIYFTDDQCFLSEIASLIKKEFTECLVKDCLMKTIQSTSSNVDSNFQEEIREFQEALCAYGFYNEADTAILDFAKDIHVHYANKECQQLLKKSREIMKKDIHDAIDVNPDETFDHGDQSSAPPLSVPKMKISSNIMELQELILDILQECGKAESAMLRQRLLCTACNVIRLYQSIVLVHHNNLINIPKQSALFHNNCMYLANWLLTISIQMQSYNITKEEIGITLYSDQISSLRLLGTKYLNQQMKQQKNIMINTLRDSDLNLLSQVTKLSKTNEAVSKCIEQINDLESHWFQVLPDNVFARCIALLYNVLLGELIQRVCSAEDISAAVAADLVKYFDDVQKNALCMFKKHTDVMSRVQLWQKFQELKNVLKGNLESIESQWANGKGLLATVFEKQEIKHLIRALFQNTDRRAELLMKLK